MRILTAFLFLLITAVCRAEDSTSQQSAWYTSPPPTVARQRVRIYNANGDIKTSTTLTAGALTASRALASNSLKAIVSTAVTDAQLGYLGDVTSAIQTQINGKEPTIAAGTTSQYWRGDKSWQTLSTAVYALLSGTAPITFNSGTGAIGFTGILPIANLPTDLTMVNGSGPPTVAIGSGAGTGSPSAAIGTNGVDGAHILSVTTTISCASNATVATVTYVNAAVNNTVVSISPANAATAALTDLIQVFSTGTASTYLIKSTGALGDTTTYSWNVIVRKI